MLQLIAATLRANSNHDLRTNCDRIGLRRCACRIGQASDAAIGEHDALSYGLLRRSAEALVEPDGVRADDFVEAGSNFIRAETAAQHLRGEQANRHREARAGGEDFEYARVVVIDCDVEVLMIEWN